MKVEFLNDINSKALETMAERKLSKREKYYKGGEPKISVMFLVKL